MAVDERMLKSSDARLWRLIEERAQPGADVADIDRRIWELFGETWAIVFTDLAGFSRQVEAFGIIHFLQVIHDKKQLLLPIIERHDGFLVKSEADSFLALFRSAAGAIQCSVEMQHASQMSAARRVPEEQVLLCVGIGYGRILRIGDTDVWGKEVNAASKLGEDTAREHEILVTQSARDAAGELPDVEYEDLELAVPGSPANYRVRYRRRG